MKCNKCGAELQEGVLFCRDCGTKIQKKKYCRDCGAEIIESGKFCPNCGANLSLINDFCEESIEYSIVDEGTHDTSRENFKHNPSDMNSYQNNLKSSNNKITAKIKQFWKKLELFYKFVIVILLISLIMFLIAWGKHNIGAIVLSVIQIIAIIVSIFMHKNIIKVGKMWVKYLVLLGCICFAVFNCMSYSEKKHISETINETEIPVVEDISDTTNSDVVEPVTVTLPLNSNECIDMDYNSVETAFQNSGLLNISYETVEDLHFDEADKVGNVISVNIAGNQDFSKGQEIDPETEIIITYHSFTKCKVNVHINFISNLFFDKYDIDYDFGGYSKGTLTHGEDTDFEVFVDPGEYKLKIISSESASVKGEIVQAVEGDINVSYDIHCSSDEITIDTDYIEKLGVATENEIMMPATASDYKYKNYQEVETSLKELGFTNISTEILYDIYYGITKEGETDNISIDGNSQFNRGDIFSKDANIVITYHMKEEDDPNKVVEETDTDYMEVETNDDDELHSVTYSTNKSNTVRNGNKGVYSYIKRGKSYDIYYIIDFDEGYVYYFTDGNGDDGCDKVKIESGDLNDKVIITYHDGSDVWSYGLHFKYVNSPSTLIMQDQNGFEYEYTTTDLTKALSKKNSKSIREY